MTKPRNVRNWWIEVEVDGRATKVALGPVARDGGFDLVVKMRSGGEVAEALWVTGRARGEDLTLRVWDRQHPRRDAVLERRTSR